MNRVRGRAATIAAGACVAAMLAVVPSAQAGVTMSNIATPTDLTWLVYNTNNPNTFAVAGTSNGTAGNHVDVRCYDADSTHLVAGNVAVNANGSFSVPAANLHSALTYRICNLHAVPVGTTPANPSAYPGPRVLVDNTETKKITSGGPNNGHVQDFYAFAEQLKGGFDYSSLGGCGVADSYLLTSNNSLGTVPFYCNAWLTADPEYAVTRSQLQIDGANAYPPYAAKSINDQATGLPTVAYTYSLDKKTGNFVIHDTETLVKCLNATYPATNVTCPTFVPTGVIDHRIMVQDHAGLVAWVTDVFTSTDGKAHTLDLLWQNDQHLIGNGSGYSAANVEYKFPGQSAYSSHSMNDHVPLPARPGTILIRMHGTADGDVLSGRAAIVYDRSATAAVFNHSTSNQDDFTLGQKANVPAHGSARFRFAYVQDFTQASVDSLAAAATTIYKGCTVPNVAGKTLAAAKKAITHAHCMVGKISHASSTTIAAGHVISSKPKAKTHVDYATKVALVVSKG